MNDPIFFVLFFFVVVPLILLNFNSKRKRDLETQNLQRETNRLLAEIAAALKKSPL